MVPTVPEFEMASEPDNKGWPQTCSLSGIFVPKLRSRARGCPVKIARLISRGIPNFRRQCCSQVKGITRKANLAQVGQRVVMPGTDRLVVDGMTWKACKSAGFNDPAHMSLRLITSSRLKTGHHWVMCSRTRRLLAVFVQKEHM